ncbi:MAG: hypothetical protein HOV80_11815, partial [Polyangiaceae bacterium]|nr:hypothetical protein [Polyangiaceae bacterium]
VEFAIKDGIPYAIDFTNPAPDMDIWSIQEKYFHIVVDWMADMAIRMARDESNTMTSGYRWHDLVGPKEDPLSKG